MNLKTKKILLLVVPLLIGGGVIFAMNKNKKRSALSSGPGEAEPTPAPLPPPAFPLKHGSRGEKVKELQAALGLSGKDVDGIFGDGTLSKLKSVAGVSEVANQAELDQIKRKAVGVTNLARANDLVTRFKKGGVAVYTTAQITIQKVQPDVSGALINTGQYITMAKSKLYNNQDYKLLSSTKLGNIVMEITRGALAGQYVVDPNTITLVTA